MGDHAKLSPSSAHRWMNCPSSPALSEGIPDEGSAHAAEGTFAHDVAAKLLADGVDGVNLTAYTDGTHVVDDAMSKHLQTYINAVRSVGLVHGFDTEELKIEQRVRLANLAPSIHGTADAVIFSRRRIDVVDLKFGAGVYVDVVDNPQLMVYGLGALLTWSGKVVDTVGLHIVQPRHRIGPAWRSQVFAAKDLIAWGERELQPAVLAAELAGPTDNLHAGDWCRWCPAAGKCPALRSKATETAAAVFDGPALAPSATPPDPGELSADDMAKVLDAEPMLTSWIKAVRAEAYRRATSGKPIPGYKLVQKVGNRRWKDEAAAVEELRSYSVDPYAERIVVSPAEAERRLGANKAIAAPLTTQPVTGTALVPESDKRKAIESGSAFDVIPQPNGEAH